MLYAIYGQALVKHFPYNFAIKEDAGQNCLSSRNLNRKPRSSFQGAAWFRYFILMCVGKNFVWKWNFFYLCNGREIYGREKMTDYEIF